MKKKLTAIMFSLLFVFPVLCFAGEYVLIKGKGVEICEEYGKNINSLKPSHFLTRCERKLNPDFKDFSKPQWGKMYFEDVESKKLFPEINEFLWERDTNPVYYFPVTEWKDWRGTPKQYSRAWEHYKGSRQSHLSIGLPVSKVDIDNDGKMDNISSDGAFCSDYGILLVLNEDKTAIDFKKTSLVLQHPSRKAKGKKELTEDGKKMRDALHTLSYNVFIYKQKTYFDLWIDLWEERKEMKTGSFQGELQVFITEDKKTHELCKYQFK